jgi:glycosyltransferase involved in cell wall biosynthesis
MAILNGNDGMARVDGSAESETPRPATISVALCVLNGERFLGEQLESISAQSRLPDELVLVDDGSCDRTVPIARGFAATAPFPMRVVVNERRLGVTKNFERALGLCSGSMIAMCAHDDVWKPRKLLVLEEALAAAPDAGLAFCDADVVDGSLRPLGYRFWRAIRFGRRELALVAAGRAFEPLLKRTFVGGTLSLFRSSYLDSILPIPPTWQEDSWIALMIAAQARIVAVSEPLNLYRQHGANLVGGAKRGIRDQLNRSLSGGRGAYELAARQFEEARERLSGRPEVVECPAWARDGRLLDEKIAHMRRRAALSASRAARLPILLGELFRGRYRRYSNGMRSFWRDFAA